MIFDVMHHSWIIQLLCVVCASELANECTYVSVGGIECHMWTHSKLNWWILLFLTEQLEANSYGFEKKKKYTLNNLNWTCLLAGHPYRLIYLAGGLPSHFHPYISRSKFMWTGGRTDIRRWLSLTIIKPFLSTLFINTLQKQLFVPGFLLSTFIPSLRLSSLLFLGCSFFCLYTTSTALSSSFLALQCGWMVGMKEATRRYASLYVFVSFQF